MMIMMRMMMMVMMMMSLMPTGVPTVKLGPVRISPSMRLIASPVVFLVSRSSGFCPRPEILPR